MGKNRTKKQHFVPQFYLKGFAGDKGKLFCYDKLTDKAYPTKILAAAQEAFFYDLPADAVAGQQIDSQMVEKALSAVESAVAPILAELMRSADNGKITSQQVIEVAPYVVIQWTRTKSYREASFELMQKAGQSLVDEIMTLNHPGEKSPTFVLHKEQMPVIQAQQLFDRDKVKQVAAELERHLWLLGINDTRHPFYTSDHPVVRRANLHADGRDLLGVDEPGVEFVFPLSKRHVLLIRERSFFAEWKKRDLCAFPLTVEQVQDCNRLQVMKSSQKIYCGADDFDLARRICKEHPEVRDPNRSRVKVEFTPIQDMKSYTIVTALE